MKLIRFLIFSASTLFCDFASGDVTPVSSSPKARTDRIVLISPIEANNRARREQFINGTQAVLPGVEVLVQQSAGVNNEWDCEQEPSSIEFQPLLYGTARWSVDYIQVQCKTPMTIARDNIYYTWTSAVDVQPGTYDRLQWSWRKDSPSLEEWHEVKAYIKSDSINVNDGYVSFTSYGPASTSGAVKLLLTKGDGSVYEQKLDLTIQGNGQYPASDTVAFSRTSVPKGNYIEAKLRWTAFDGASGTSWGFESLPYRFESAWRVLGIIKYTQYNTPDESACQGSPTMVWVVDDMASCDFTSTTMVSKFASQVNINGTGKSLLHGLVKTGLATDLARRCRGKFPPGANLENSYLQVPSVTGSCNRPLAPYSVGATSSVATPPEYAIACGRTMTLVNRTSGTTEDFRKRDDTCPLCSTPVPGVDGHIDQYSSAVACSGHGVGDFGVYWTSLLAQ